MSARTPRPMARFRKECRLAQRQMAAKLAICLRAYQYLECEGRGDYSLIERSVRIFTGILGRTVTAQYDLLGWPTPVASDEGARTWERLPGQGRTGTLRALPPVAAPPIPTRSKPAK